MFSLSKTKINGCFELYPRRMSDERGMFVKTFHREAFEEMQLQTRWVEEYYSVSRKGVLRGLHFQLPPHDHDKLVYSVCGEVFDVVVDLRVGSPTYGQFETFTLDAEKSNMIYIPKGMAHGFLTLSGSATLLYKVGSIYSSEHDTGILWDSVGIPWPTKTPIISDRDKAFVSLQEFASPFEFTRLV